MPQQIWVTRVGADREVFESSWRSARSTLHGNNILTGEQADSSVAPDPSEWRARSKGREVSTPAR
ncbi:hypothetical protein [Nocardia sp. NPDC006630]|uniref:hypothetical protein n=1 Tax=Nocardia sp. NPDC006630 TaxID=3157181 RepID=UPI0033BFA978